MTWEQTISYVGLVFWVMWLHIVIASLVDKVKALEKRVGGVTRDF